MGLVLVTEIRINLQTILENLVFLHIPKAAGSTFIAILRNNFPDNICVLPILNKKLYLDEFTGMSEKEKASLKVLAGHVYYGIHEKFTFPENVKYVTFLRNPVDRIISHYHYAKREKNHYLHEEIVRNNYSLEDYLTKLQVLEVDNGQTRMISGINPEFGKCSQEMLDIAKLNLTHFLLAGITRDFDKGLVLLKKKKVLNSIYYLKGNVTKGKKQGYDPESPVVKLIENYNQLDIQLFQYCKQLFNEELNNCGVTKFDIISFKFLNLITKVAVNGKTRIKEGLRIIQK